MNSSKIKWLISLVLFAIVAVAGYQSFSKANKKQEKPVIQEISPSRKDMISLINTTGVVEPKNRVTVMPPVNGRIEEIFVREGSVVKKGAVLALMSSTDRAALLDAARTNDPAQLAYWEKVYQPTPLMAAISGTIIVRDAEPGQSANTNTAIFVIADTLIVKAQVDETDIGNVKTGQKANIALDAYPDLKIPARVGHISYESQNVNNVIIYQVEILPDKIPDIIRSGMSAYVEIIRQSHKNVLSVPEDFIKYQDDQATVRIKNDTSPRPKRTIVQTGLTQDGYTEIISGVTDNDILIKIIPPKEKIVGQKEVKSFISRPRMGGAQGGRGAPH